MKKLLMIFITIIVVIGCKKQEIKPTMLCSVRTTYKDNTQSVILGEMNAKELQQYVSTKYKIVEIYCSNETIKGK